MKHIDRLSIPQILQEKQTQWQSQFLQAFHAGTKKRPDSTKYGNPKILDRLKSMSYGKCFYCESSLKGTVREIDHFIEVADAPELAYSWDNLYLSCSNCNDKIPHRDIPVQEVLDPCSDSDEVIQQNITFQEELICAIPGSSKGLKTIKKYRLDSELLDHKRLKWLNTIWKVVYKIQQTMIAEQRQSATHEEKKLLRQFMLPNQPYSLMSEIYIKSHFSKLME